MINKIIKSLVVLLVLLSLSNAQTNNITTLTEGLKIQIPKNLKGKKHDTIYNWGENVMAPNFVVKGIYDGTWKAPSENKKVVIDGVEIATWKNIIADETGWYKDKELRGNSYVYFEFQSDKEQIVLIEAMGNRNLFVNGKVRSGNPYRYKDEFEPWGPRFDYSFIPVKLKKGKNDLLFSCRRGLLKVRIHENQDGLLFAENDLTIPDLIVNEEINTYGAIPIINASEKEYENVFVKTWIEGSEPVYYPVKKLYPLTIYKTRFNIELPTQTEIEKIKFNLEVVEEKSSSKALASVTIDLNVVELSETHKETFLSDIDGSVQYYAVNPPTEKSINPPALFLSLHGAGVEAINQAQAYGHKNWGYTVAPTNRRPYGYNWENWGRLDAMEVLDLSKEKFGIDEERVYLTGHSMGGHGSWHVGFNYPDKFAAIGPSAGWISIWSYRIISSADSNRIKKMLMRSTKQSDTYAFTKNFNQNGLYILHGDADDNVPVGQAESIIENISKFHKDYEVHIEPEAGHWWDNSEEPGADCTDWAPMFNFFSRHTIPGKERITEVDFTTANPTAASKNNWIEIINQVEQQKISNVKFNLMKGINQYEGTTENVSKISLDASVLISDEPITIIIDDQEINDVTISEDEKIILELKDEDWIVGKEIDENNKYPARCGNFREAFNNNVLFVFGTNGSDEENTIAFEKARFDAEKIWYRGNASIDIIEDSEFELDLYRDRSVILFGNSETNSAWDKLLADSPVQINDDEVIYGEKQYKGDDLACLFIYPRKDSKVASVAVVGGSGAKGLQLANLAPYFNQYMSLPDLIIYDSEIINSDEKGVKVIGYFGNDWSISNGEFEIQ